MWYGVHKIWHLYGKTCSMDITMRKCIRHPSTSCLDNGTRILKKELLQAVVAIRKLTLNQIVTNFLFLSEQMLSSRENI